MKHLKSYKLFENQNFDWFRDLFQELKDEGYHISVKESLAQKIDFSEVDFFDSSNLKTKDDSVKTIDVKVEKRVNAQDNTRFFGPTLKEFNIDDIKETLRFAESYAKDELGLELEYIYTMRVPRYTYYKSVDVLPDNQTIDSVTFAFRKID
jgi:hypothetical protein